MASLRSIAAGLGVPYSTAYITLEKLLGLRPRHITAIDNSDGRIINGDYVAAVIRSVPLLARNRLEYYTMPPLPL